MPTFLKAMLCLQELSLHSNEFVDVGADVKVSDTFYLDPTPQQYNEIVKASPGGNVVELASQILDGVSPSLMSLRLDDNRLLKWGRWIPNASSLTLLSLDNNRIEMMPSASTALTNLKYFSSRDNLMAQLPLELSGFTALHTIHVDRNRIVDVPPSMRKLTNLTILTLSDNCLKGTWRYFQISSLPNLVELRLRGNQLQSPPMGVARLPKLKHFDWRPVLSATEQLEQAALESRATTPGGSNSET